MTEPTATQRLIEALKEAKIPQKVVAQKLLLPSSAVSNIFSGTRRLTFDEADKLQKLLGQRQAGGREIPLIGMAGAGNWLEAIEQAGRQVWIPAHLGTAKFAIEIVGSSMDLLLPEGSIAVIDPDDKEMYSGKIYLLLNADGEATVKRYRTDPARFEPVSSDPSFVPFALGTTDFRIVGRVVAAIQQL